MIVRLDSPQGPQVLSPSEVIKHFARQTQDRQTQWGRSLSDNPDSLAEMERVFGDNYSFP